MLARAISRALHRPRITRRLTVRGRTATAQAAYTPPAWLDGFWARNDLFIMEPTTLGYDGTVNTWPAAVYQPVTAGYGAVVFLPGDYTARADNDYGAGFFCPKNSGTALDPILYVFATAEDAPFAGMAHPSQRAEKAEFNLIFMPSNVAYNYFWGLSLNETTAFFTNRQNDGIIEYCDFTPQAQPLRIRFGASRNLVRYCRFERSVPFATTGDIVAVQVVDDENLDNIIEHCTFVNYTDSFQTTARYGLRGMAVDETDEYGYSAGTIFRHNTCIFTEAAHNMDGTSDEGCENFIDLKTGGTIGNPILIHDNLFAGNRPNVGSPGYCINIKDVATDINIYDNEFVDCESGLFINAAYLYDKAANGWYVPRVNVHDNLFSNIKDNGSGLFAGKAGRVWVGLNTMTFQDNEIVECDYLAEDLPDAAAIAITPMAFGGNLVHQTIDLDAYTGTWADGTISSGYTIAEEIRAVPFTNYTVTVRRKIPN